MNEVNNKYRQKYQTKLKSVRLSKIGKQLYLIKFDGYFIPML